MGCRRIRPMLSLFIDGDLTGARVRVVAEHVAECAVCARELGALSRMVGAARALAALEPPTSVLDGALFRLGEQGRPASQGSVARGRLPFWRALVVAGATFAVVLAARTRSEKSLAVSRAAGVPTEAELVESAVGEVARADADYGRAILDLRRLVEVESRRWQPFVARAFAENLAAIDQAILRQRAAAAEVPADPAGHEALFASYRRQMDFLEEALVRGEGAP